MTPRQPYEVRVSAPALEDISDIWGWTVEHFGTAAALRYEGLIEQAIADLADDPERPAAKHRPELLPGLWSYHLAASRTRVEGDRVRQAPRHFVLFRYLQPGVIEIVRVLHDSRDLSRHVPAEILEE